MSKHTKGPWRIVEGRMDDMLESLLDKDSETVPLDELKAAKRCFELLGNDEAVKRIASKIDEVREVQP